MECAHDSFRPEVKGEKVEEKVQEKQTGGMAPGLLKDEACSLRTKVKTSLKRMEVNGVERGSEGKREFFPRTTELGPRKHPGNCSLTTPGRDWRKGVPGGPHTVICWERGRVLRYQGTVINMLPFQKSGKNGAGETKEKGSGCDLKKGS